MSQIYKSSASGPVPPTVATSYTTQNGTAVPAANILIINANDSTENNDNGIISKGGVAGTGTANEVDIIITNRLQGTGTTVGVIIPTADVITFLPLTIGTYSLEYAVSAYNTTSTLGAGYKVFGAVRFDGVNSHICGSADTFDNEEGAMVACDLDVVVSGANIILRVTGYAGQTINWGAVGFYTFRGV